MVSVVVVVESLKYLVLNMNIIMRDPFRRAERVRSEYNE